MMNGGRQLGKKDNFGKRKRMARVVGEKEGRARIVLPPLPNLGFEKENRKEN